jgi:hypothetical protein
MRRVYRIDTDITPEENDIITNQMDKEDVELIHSLGDIDNFDDIDDEGKIVTYMICTEEQLEVLKSMANKYKVNLEINDITNMYLNDIVQIDDVDFQRFKDEELKK